MLALIAALAPRSYRAYPGSEEVSLSDPAYSAPRNANGKVVIPVTCSNCGHSGPDVVETMHHVGGHGYQGFPLCADQATCWRRRDAQDAPWAGQKETAGVSAPTVLV